MKKNGIWHCDFCDKDQREVEKIITGTGDVAICNRCVSTCLEVILNAAKDTAIAEATVVPQQNPPIKKGGY